MDESMRQSAEVPEQDIREFCEIEANRQRNWGGLGTASTKDEAVRCAIWVGLQDIRQGIEPEREFFST